MTREAAPALLFLALAVGFSAPVLRGLHHWGIQDWDFHLHHHAAARIAILEHGELPLWNPYNWSGTPLLGHPLSRVCAPTFLLTLALGEVVAMKLEIVLHLLLGMLGAHLLLRALGASRIAAAAAAALFMLNSWYALHVTVGHVESHAYAYLPWAVLFHRKALDDGHPRWSLALSLVLVLTIFGGAPYQFAIFTLALAVLSVAEIALGGGRAGRHARLALAVALQVVLLGAVKVFPMVDVMTTWPRHTDVVSSFTPAAFLHALFARAQTLDAAWAGRPGEFNGTTLHEGMYVGLLPLVPFVVGVRAGWRRHGSVLACLVLFAWISLGRSMPIDLAAALHRLPVFDSMRMFQRFGIVVLVCFAAFAGLGIDALREGVARRRGTRVATGCALVVSGLMILDLLLVNAPILRDAFPIAPRLPEAHADFRQMAGFPVYGAEGWAAGPSPFLHRTLSGLYPATLASRGSTRGYRSLLMPSAAVPSTSPAYRGEVFLPGGQGSVTVRSWSPSRIAVEVDAPAGGALVVNQNFAPGWWARTDAGLSRAVVERGGVLSVAIEPGDRFLEIFYRPTSFVAGALTSLVGLPAVLLWALRRRVRTPRGA